MLEQIQPMVKPKLELRICGCEVAVALITLSGCLFKVNICLSPFDSVMDILLCTNLVLLYLISGSSLSVYFFTAIDGWFSLKLY